MDFDGAIEAHTKWKIRLRSCIAGKEKFDPAFVAQDHQCALGSWIYGEGKRHATLADFAALKSEHAEFHKSAAEVVTRANAGDLAGAEAMLGAGSKFAKVSTKVVGSIMKIRKVVEAR